ncbi:MAG: SurA N-terminal domain-containing protein [Gammaproteobacteria bacterium]
MLTSFRSHIKGWIAWVFVILVSVPFALWGVSSYRSVITTDYVAKVNGEKILPPAFQRSYQQVYQQRENSLNGKFNPTPGEEKALKQQVLQQLITQTLLRQQANSYHLLASEADVRAEIGQIPAFQANGHFSLAQYQAVLASNGMSTDQFEAQVRTGLRTQVLQRGLAGSAFATPQQTDALIGLLKEQRKIAWLELPLAHFMPKEAPSEQEIAAYYKSHAKDFTTPMTVTINYVQLDPQALEARIKTSDEDLQAYYRTHQSDYGIPPARKTAQILIKPAAPGTQGWAAAAAKAKKLLGEIQAAADPEKKFAVLAKQNSDDKVSARNDGSMGYLGRGQMPQAFDNALFGIKKTGGVAGPVRTTDGWHLIQFLAERGGSVKPYAEVKTKVEKDYRASKAKDLYFTLGDQLANLSYENPGSLDPVAKALNLKVQTLSGVTAEQGQGIASDETIRKAAFSDSLLKMHQNSAPVKLGDLNAVVLRVADSQPSHAKPLAEVRDTIVGDLKKQQALASAEAAAVRAVSALHAGKTVAEVAKSLGVTAHASADYTRGEAKLPPALEQAAFAAPPPAANKPDYGMAGLSDGNPAVFALLAVTPGNPRQLKQQEQQAYLMQLAQLNATQEFTDYLAWLRAHAEIKIDQDNIP